MVRLTPVAGKDRHARGARLVDHLRGRGDVSMSTDAIILTTGGD
jgi:hypothetical protein